MGSAGTHGQITAHVVSQLRRVRPDEEYTYLELGNFLTDFSQLRDPYACIHGKRAVFRTASMVPILGPLVALAATSKWLPDLLGRGRPPSKREDGALTRFLVLIAKTATHGVFADDSPLPPSAIESALGFRVARMPAAEVDRVLATALTQYYPHEHLDFPPYLNPDSEDSRGGTAHGTRDHNRLIAYLRDEIQYVVESLTKVEVEWVTSSRLPASSAARRDSLRHLGHVLHAVEDYFFHSNFAEIYQWQRLRRSHPERRKENTADWEWLLLHDLDDSGEDQPRDAMLRRRLARRLHYPAFTRPGAGFPPTATYWENASHYTSKDAFALVYTGGYGANDIFHSISGLVEALDRAWDLLSPMLSLIMGRVSPGEELALNRMLVNREVRRQAGRSDKYRHSLVTLHDKQLVHHSYRDHIRERLRNGGLSPAMAAALEQAFAIDLDFRSRHWAKLPSVGGFLIMLLGDMQAEIDRNQKRVERLNADERSVLARATDNGASAETIGTHSLLAKDTGEEGPLRKAALALAKHASASLAVLMANRVNRNQDLRQGMDWDSILRHFLRFPRIDPNSWESTIIPQADSHMPDVDSVSEQPNFQMLGPAFHADKLQRLRQGGKREELEKLYRGLEVIEDR